MSETNKPTRRFPRKEDAMKKPIKKSKPAPERAVVICTDKRGVFFGYATDTTGDPIRLTRARMCIYWSADVRGVMGLAVTGPSAACKIGPAVTEIELRGVTCVIETTSDAVAAWERAPWTR